MGLTEERKLQRVITIPATADDDMDEVIIAGSIAAGAAGADLYTVAADKILRVTFMSLTISSNTNAADYGAIGLNKGGSTTYPLYLIAKILTGDVTAMVRADAHANASFHFPPRLNATDKVTLAKTTANLTAIYYIRGYLIDAT